MENPQILGAPIQNSVTQVTWCPGFVHVCSKTLLSFKKKIINIEFERAENFKHLGVILSENNNHHTYSIWKNKNANKTYFMLQHLKKNKNISKKLKLVLKNTIIDNTLTAYEHIWKKVCRWILGPVYDNEKESWRILTNKEIYAIIKNLTITETIRLHRLCWFGYVERME
jgi:hypothetical protein